MRPERTLTPGRYALDGNGRLYSIRGPWRRNAVAVVILRPRETVEVLAPARLEYARPDMSGPKCGLVDEADTQERSVVAGESIAVNAPATPATKPLPPRAVVVDALTDRGAARPSSARFKPFVQFDPDEAAARAYERAIEERQGRD